MFQHFPGLKKYVSLYKLNKDVGEDASTSASVTDATREEVRSWVSKCTKNGELSAEPELVLNKSTNVGAKQHPRGDEDEEDYSNDEGVPTSKGRATKQPIFKSKLRTQERKETSASNLTLAGDDFFGEDG